jgi:mRNA-degrading endonuclease RelE of RelBE toxin-antitoxin system
MSYKVKTIPSFEKELKQLSKKYPSLKKDYESFLDYIEENPLSGTAIGKDCYKIRFAIKSKTKGKSGGARIITCVKVIQSTVFLISVYDKSEIENISDSALKLKLKEIEF